MLVLSSHELGLGFKMEPSSRSLRVEIQSSGTQLWLSETGIILGEWLSFPTGTTDEPWSTDLEMSAQSQQLAF
jgi:hypothetical protein